MYLYCTILPIYVFFHTFFTFFSHIWLYKQINGGGRRGGANKQKENAIECVIKTLFL